MSRLTAPSSAPDERLSVGGASCSLWWSRTPRFGGARSGAIGQVAAPDARHLAALLDRACEALAARGCAFALGPLDGTTWGRYRAIVERGGEPPFFLEPDGPDHVAHGFRAAGFEAAASYVSALEEPIACNRARTGGVERLAARNGIRIRPLDLSDLDGELRRMHALCMAAFRGAFLFTPIAEEEFVARLRPLGAFVRPEFAMVAEQGGHLVAMLFALPDALEAARGETPSTLIVKTIAALPGRRHAGLAHLLAERVAINARAMGLRRAVHALMHQANGSASWSAKLGRPFRRYALFSKRLERISKPSVMHA